MGGGQLRVSFRRLRGRRAGGEDRRRPRRAAPAGGDRLHRAGGRGDALAGRAARARTRARRGGDRGARRRRQARGPVHDHLHVGDDRAAQGLRPDPRQLPVGHPHVRGDRRHRGGRARLPLPAAGALLRAADPAAGRRPRRADRLLERRPAADRAGPDGDQAGLPAVGAADLREDLHARHVQQRSGEDQGRDEARAHRPAHARGRPGGPGRPAGDVRQGRRRAVRQRARDLRRQPQAGDLRRRADLDGDPRVLLRLRRARARGLRDDRDLDGVDHLDGRRSPPGHGRPRDPRAARSRSAPTARSSSAGRTSSRATTRATTPARSAA